MNDVKSYGENVAAITAHIHENKDQYDKLYALIADKVGGFVGIWSMCADAAFVFSEEEKPYTAGEDFYWIEAIEGYAQSLTGYWAIGNLLTIPDMRRLAAGAIEKNRVNR